MSTDSPYINSFSYLLADLPQSNTSIPLDCDDAGARRWKEMGVEQKTPWIELGKLASEQYAKAKVRLDEKNAVLMKTVAALGPKKRAAAEAKAITKTRVMSKAKVKPLPAKVKDVPKVVKATPTTLKATPSRGKVKMMVTMTDVDARGNPLGAVAKATVSNRKKSPSLGAKKSVIKVCRFV